MTKQMPEKLTIANTHQLHEVKLSILEDFISFHMGAEYKMDTERYLRSGYPLLLVEKESRNAEWIQEMKEEWRIYGIMPATLCPAYILEDLCCRGLLEPGWYYIDKHA